MFVSRSAAAALALFAVTTGPAAAGPQDEVRALTASPAFKTAVATLDRERERILADTITLTEIPAPPFKEEARAQAYMSMLKAHGLGDVEMDPEGNVMGLRRGTGPAGGPVVIVAAHLDTVFPEGTPIKVRQEGERYLAPGIADDTRSLAVLLGWVRALDAAKITTERDILFVGNVGEEGPGDLRGARYIFTKGKYKDRVHAFLSIDGVDPTAVVNGGVGSRRYRVTFKGPGGHSYGAFGVVNPLAALGKAVTDFNTTEVPQKPRTTYATSVVGGGTSVNSIPDAVWLEVDMRSEDKAELAKLDARFQQVVEAAVAHENSVRNTRFGKIVAEVKLIGDRPAGLTAKTAPIVQIAAAAVRAAGFEPRLSYGSTDSNIPISLGLPAVTMSSGGRAGRGHSVDEWLEVPREETVRGMSAGLATILTLAGS